MSTHFWPTMRTSDLYHKSHIRQSIFFKSGPFQLRGSSEGKVVHTIACISFFWCPNDGFLWFRLRRWWYYLYYMSWPHRYLAGICWSLHDKYGWCFGFLIFVFFLLLILLCLSNSNWDLTSGNVGDGTLGSLFISVIICDKYSVSFFEFSSLVKCLRMIDLMMFLFCLTFFYDQLIELYWYIFNVLWYMLNVNLSCLTTIWFVFINDTFLVRLLFSNWLAVQVFGLITNRGSTGITVS